MSDTPRLRPTSRVLLIDARDRVLLVCHTGFQGEFESLWVPPGGGVEKGESHEEAALRELGEEVGLSNVQLGPCVWHRRNVFDFGEGAYTFEEHFFICRVEAFDVGDHVNPDEVEAAMVAGSRWWTVEEIAMSSEYFAPRDLARLLQPLLVGDVPAEPLVIGL